VIIGSSALIRLILYFDDIMSKRGREIKYERKIEIANLNGVFGAIEGIVTKCTLVLDFLLVYLF
jgi:hypothetical protein